ncbi:hypothetical protein ACFOMD_11640 [Sphingoaurantiacus capsulatus]|uniref:Tryptophan-rich sensory protein n=1 Tax=Sphingoaurantiacus capsulatus TaxID=1771310 RepID=A0ABV7XAR1_9SPHN
MGWIANVAPSVICRSIGFVAGLMAALYADVQGRSGTMRNFHLYADFERGMTPDTAHRPLAQRLAIILFALAQIATPLLPRFGIGQPVGEQSDMTRTLITPAGWAFSIWGALYLGAIVYAIWQALPAQRANALLARIAWPSAGAFAANAAWVAYTQVYGLGAASVAIILFGLACVLFIYRAFAAAPGFTTGERWCAVLPLSALSAWLSAAAIVNIAASLKFYGVEMNNVPPVAAAVIAVGGIIAATAIWRGRGNPWYALVFLWALAAIYAAGGQESSLVAAATGLSALLVLLSAGARLNDAGNRHHWFRGRPEYHPTAAR